MARRKSRRRSPAAGLPVIIGIAWYDAVQWAKLKQVAADPEFMDATHEDWRRGAEDLERKLRRLGTTARRVPIDVDALARWCRTQRKAVDANSRVEYVNEIMRGANPP
jgi:hypothetical protein